MNYIDWDNCDEDYVSDKVFWAETILIAKKRADEEDEKQRERNHKYEWDANHGLI